MDTRSSKIRNTAVIALMIAVTAGVVLLYVKDTQKKNSQALEQKNKEEQTSGFTSSAKELTLEDIDGDGLLDWEEKLWGTNPNNADSDGDGILDLEETRTGGLTVSKESGNKVREDFSITESFGISLYSGLAQASRDGEVSGNDLRIIAESTQRQIKQELTRKNAITQKVNYTELTEESLNIYAASLLVILLEHPTGVEFITSFKEGLDELESISDSRKLSLLASSMKSAVTILLETTTPTPLKTPHEQLLRSYNTLHSLLEAMINSEGEPIVALLYLQKLEEALVEASNSFFEIQRRVEQNI